MERMEVQVRPSEATRCGGGRAVAKVPQVVCSAIVKIPSAHSSREETADG